MEGNDSNLQELQFLEQNLQNLLYQKQAFDMELSETASALSEIESSSEDVFKIVGNLMIKTQKSKVKEELENKQKLLKLRLDSLEKQEEKMNEKVVLIRGKLLGSKK